MHSGRLCKPEREAVFFVTQPDGSSAQPPSPPPLPGLEHLALPRGPKPREDDTVFVFYVFWKEKCSSRTFVDLMSQRLGEKLSRDRPEPRDGSASNTIPVGSLVPCWAHRWSPARAKCGHIRQCLPPPPPTGQPSGPSGHTCPWARSGTRSSIPTPRARLSTPLQNPWVGSSATNLAPGIATQLGGLPGQACEGTHTRTRRGGRGTQSTHRPAKLPGFSAQALV